MASGLAPARGPTPRPGRAGRPRPSPSPSAADPLDVLVGPHRTPWGTWVYSAIDAPPIESFGPIEDDDHAPLVAPAVAPAPPISPWSQPAPLAPRRRTR